MLQAMRGAEISQNGEGVDHRVERNHAEGAYPRDTHGRASSSSAEKRRSEGLRGVEAVIWPERRCSGGGVRCRSSEIGQLGR